MATATAKTYKRSTVAPVEERKDVFQIVTDRIVSLLEEGVNPWKKTWNVPNGAFNGPANFVTKRPYSGINFFLLSFSSFESPFFLTMKQVNDLKGRVKKGEKSQPIIFVKVYDKTETKEIDGNTEEVTNRSFCYKMYHVFNIEQTTLEIPPVEVEKTDHNLIIDSCEKILKGYSNAPKLEHKGGQPCYMPLVDKVLMPKKNVFHSLDQYYTALFHEMIHSTGAEKRLNREGITDLIKFGSEKYSREELVAELGAAYINSITGIVTPDLETNSAAYIKGWLKPLKGDKKFIFKAAAEAQKAVNHILGQTV